MSRRTQTKKIETMDDIPTLRDMDYKNLFIACTYIDINNKEKREVSKPSTDTDTNTVTTDGFDWDEDFRRAYSVKK